MDGISDFRNNQFKSCEKIYDEDLVIMNPPKMHYGPWTNDDSNYVSALIAIREREFSYAKPDMLKIQKLDNEIRFYFDLKSDPKLRSLHTADPDYLDIERQKINDDYYYVDSNLRSFERCLTYKPRKYFNRYKKTLFALHKLESYEYGFLAAVNFTKYDDVPVYEWKSSLYKTPFAVVEEFVPNKLVGPYINPNLFLMSVRHKEIMKCYYHVMFIVYTISVKIGIPFNYLLAYLCVHAAVNGPIPYVDPHGKGIKQHTVVIHTPGKCYVVNFRRLFASIAKQIPGIQVWFHACLAPLTILLLSKTGIETTLWQYMSDRFPHFLIAPYKTYAFRFSHIPFHFDGLDNFFYRVSLSLSAIKDDRLFVDYYDRRPGRLMYCPSPTAM